MSPTKVFPVTEPRALGRMNYDTMLVADDEGVFYRIWEPRWWQIRRWVRYLTAERRRVKILGFVYRAILEKDFRLPRVPRVFTGLN